MSNVVVVGSVNVDLNLRMTTLPRPGETVVGARVQRSLGGKGANQALAAARLGATVTLVGRVGGDADGEFARSALDAAGVELQLGLGEDPTGLATVLSDETGENLIAVASGANAELTAEHVQSALNRLTVERAVLVANLEVPVAAVRAATELAHERGWPIVLNPAPAQRMPHELLADVDVLTPNEHELAALDLTHFRGALIVTRGRAGLSLIENGQSPREIPAFAVDVVDSTGAGDACTAAVAWALATGHDLGQAARAGAAAGALATRAVGAQSSLPTAKELDELLDGRQCL